jgi:hypothetical protein
MPVTHYVAETQTLRRVAKKNPRYLWSKHAPLEMADENPPITESDIRHALLRGTVVLQEGKQDILWRVKGVDLDGRSIVVVLSVDEEENAIKIITAFTGKQ